MEDEKEVDPCDLAIIITTSPIPSNPETEIIDRAIDSIKEQLCLAKVPITIICDGAKIIEQSANKYKSGLISQEALQKYEVYKQGLHQKYDHDSTITIIERKERYCFAENIRYVMTLCSQPFVLIFQHDHIFLRRVDICKVVETMKNHPINYIGFSNKSVIKVPSHIYQHVALRKYFGSLFNYKGQSGEKDPQLYLKGVLQYHNKQFGLPLLPLLFWYDKVHVARKSYYLEVIFNKKGFFNQITNSFQKTLSFVEDSFGTAIKKAIRKRPQKFQEVRSYLLWDGPQLAIRHIHGRAYLTQQMKEEKYLNNLQQQKESDQSEHSQELNLAIFDQ